MSRKGREKIENDSWISSDQIRYRHLIVTHSVNEAEEHKTLL